MSDHMQVEGRTPRRYRIERERWEKAVIEDEADGRTSAYFIFDRPYLAAHPEREIAHAVGLGFMSCPSCGIFEAQPVTHPAAIGELAHLAMRVAESAHEHNLARHPRRWLREQNFPGADLPLEILARADIVDQARSRING